MISDFNHTIETWLAELDHYDLKKLLNQPSPKGWSLGQVYVHIIRQTTFFLQQVRICSSIREHSTEAASAEAKDMFKNNAFPNLALEGPPTNDHVPQPASIDELRSQLLDLKTEANELAVLLQENPSSGKTRHPGLHYFSAKEWLQFAEMHLRHHFRQKARIDRFLKT